MSRNVQLALVALVVGGCDLDSTLPGDAAPPPQVTIEELRALPDGPADVTLEPSYVTYITVNGNGATTVFVQALPAGPGLRLFARADTPQPEVAIGNQIEVRVTEVSTFGGNKEGDGIVVITNDGGSFDVGSLTQLLSIAPNEDLESERVRIAGGTVVAETEDNRFDVRLTSNVVVEVFSPAAATAGLCPGATFDAVGVVQEFQGRHNLFVGEPGDLTNVDTTACP